MDKELRSEFKGHEYIDDTWLLTHVIWYSFSMHANSYSSCPETGIRFLKELNTKNEPRFELIQHGWHDFDKAGNFIKSALRKGLDTNKIGDVMDYLHKRAPGL